jgi:hypothetical protein
MSIEIRLLLVKREQQMLYYIWKVILLLLKDVSPWESQLPVVLPWSRDYTCCS